MSGQSSVEVSRHPAHGPSERIAAGGRHPGRRQQANVRLTALRDDHLFTLGRTGHRRPEIGTK